MKEKLKNLGRAGESYEDVIRRLYELGSKQILMTYLYDTSDSLPIDEAIKQAKKRWQE
jgi:predicted CopG family antitoxin